MISHLLYYIPERLLTHFASFEPKNKPGKYAK